MFDWSVSDVTSAAVSLGLVSIVATQHHDRRMAENSRRVAALSEVVVAFMHYQDAETRAFRANGLLKVRDTEGRNRAAMEVADARRELSKATGKLKVLYGRSARLLLRIAEAEAGFADVGHTQWEYHNRGSAEISAALDSGNLPPRFPTRFEHAVVDTAHRMALTPYERLRERAGRSVTDARRVIRHGRSPARHFANFDEFAEAVARGQVPPKRRWWQRRVDPGGAA